MKKKYEAPQHFTVASRNEAWELCNKLFPTDYEYDTERSHNAGYDIYSTTRQYGEFQWVSDLNTTLELNLAGCKTIYIDIEEPEKISWNYNGQY